MRVLFALCLLCLCLPVLAQEGLLAHFACRAQSPTAAVVISDGAESASAGQEIICNFLELQPYYDRE